MISSTMVLALADNICALSIQEDGGDLTSTNDPMNNTYNKSISILPPPNNAYNLDNNNYIFSTANQLSPLINQQQQQLYPNNNETSISTLSGTDDWLTLDLNPLLDNNSTFGSMDNPWFGNFGPEINSNLDVLGRLVNEGFNGDMGF